VEDQFRRLFDAMGIERVDFLPGRRSTELPAVGPGTLMLAAQPFVGDTMRALQARGAQWLRAPYPIGVAGSQAWFHCAGRAWGLNAQQIDAALATAIRRAGEALGRARAQLSGRSVFLMPDSMLELPLARFLHQELGMRLIEVGTPYLDRDMLAAETAQIPQGVTISEGQDVDRQLERLRAARPDITVCGLGLANPLEAEGLTTKWSIELVFSPIQGFDQACDLAALFTRPLARRAALKV
jgi:light-independent protochlorophyllide reductase subunit N